LSLRTDRLEHDREDIMRYRVLGEVVVLPEGGAPRTLTRRRERSVLGVLLAARCTPVTAERLLADAWTDVDAATLGSLQVAVSRLRAELEPDRAPRTPPRVLVSGGGGYVLSAPSDAVDAWVFESLARQALGADRAEESLRLAEEANQLWTGTPYPDCDGELLLRERDRLTELHASLLERRVEDLLALGRDADALTLAMDATGDHPFRERLWAGLALAQYRGGRQGEALETLQRLRTLLADELGVDPTPEVQDLERRLLQQDPELTAAPSRPVAARTREVAAEQPALRPPTSPTVGRDEVLALAERLLDGLRAATAARYLTVSGEPGIGKSRLVQDLQALAAQRGLRMVTGRSPEGDLVPALWPWQSVVRELAGSAATAPPHLAPLLGDGEAAADTGTGTTLRLYDAVVDLLVQSAEAADGLVVVLEDLHRADLSSLQLLTHVAAAPMAAPLLIVVTRRTTDEAAAAEPLLAALAALARAGADRIRLEGLDAAAVDDLLTAMLGDHDQQIAHRVAEATAGNPFYVVEYARLLSTRPDLRAIELDDLPVPEGVQDVLRQRLARLPETSRTLLAQAAVLGQVVEPGLTATVTGESEETVLDTLDLAVASGLLVERGAAYAFAHALTREVLADELSAARRMRLHARAVTALEQAHPRPAADVVATLAGHALAAAPLGGESRQAALTWLPRAAASAAARQAHAEALELWRAAGREADPTEPEHVAARQGEAQALLRLGVSRESRAIVQELVAEAVAREDWSTAAGSAAIATEAGVWTSREHGSKDEPFIAALTDALGHVVDPGDVARLSATLMVEHYLGFDRDRVTEYSARAGAAAREAADDALMEQVLYLQILCRSGRRRPGDREERLTLLEDLLARSPGGETEVSALFHLGWNLFELGRVEESDEAMERCRAAAADLGHAGVDVPLAWWRAARARDVDDPRAAALGREALSLHETSGVVGIDEARCVHAAANLAPGETLDQALVDLATTRGLPTRAAVAWGLVTSGQPERVGDLIADLVPPHVEDYAALAGACLQLGVLAALEDSDRVRVMVDQLLSNADAVVTYGALDHLGVVDHFLALGLRSLGQHDDALVHARRAVERLTELDVRPALHRATVLLAQLERVGGAAEA
jgi:DNA-binding SARP family transcriptional activator